jgi:hypothetical protein
MSTRSQRSQQTPPVPRKNQDQQSKKTKQQPDTNHHIDSRRPVTWHQKQSRTVEFSNNPPTTLTGFSFRLPYWACRTLTRSSCLSQLVSEFVIGPTFRPSSEGRSYLSALRWMLPRPVRSGAFAPLDPLPGPLRREETLRTGTGAVNSIGPVFG